LEFHQKALKIRIKVLGIEHPNVADSYNNIGLVYDSQGDYSNALKYLHKALNIRKKVLGDNHPGTLKIFNAIESIIKDISSYSALPPSSVIPANDCN